MRLTPPSGRPCISHERSLSLALCLAVALLVTPTSSAQWPNLPAAPLTLQSIGAPNLLVTLDDSGSMSWTAIPDDRVLSNTKRRLASRWNTLAYNPFTSYEAPFAPSLDGTRLNSAYTAAPWYGYQPGGGSVDLSSQYRPDWAYTAGNTYPCYGPCEAAGIGWTSPLELQFGSAFAAGPAYFYVFYNDRGPGGVLPTPGTDPVLFARETSPPVGCGGITDTENDACYLRVNLATESSAHRQNFANWFSFYRTRHLSAITAASIALYDLPATYRLSWQNLQNCQGFNLQGSCTGWDGIGRANPIRPLSNSQHRAAFYDWLYHAPHHFGTPLVQAFERAGQFYQSSGIESPAANQPGLSMTGPGSEPTSACRPNYHVALTDGLWNAGPSALSNVDGTARTLPDGSVYSVQAPYADVAAGTIADVAFHYWATDLQPGLANRVVPFTDSVRGAGDWLPWNDPATWQHMVNFNVGLGLSRFLNGANGRVLWGGETWSGGDWPALAAGTKPWPAATNGSVFGVSDLWHAAINSRGQFFNADNPSALTSAFRAIIARINAGQASTGQVGATGTRASSGTRMFELTYDAQAWAGRLRAYNLNLDGSKGTIAWSSDDTLTNNGGRNIFTWNNALQTGRHFAWTSFTPAEQGAYFNGSAQIFDYLAGDRSHEAIGAVPRFRPRSQLLGDIVGSDMVVSGKFDEGYSSLTGSAGTTYGAYVASKQPVAFFGANDGMLHAFRNNGAEAFAYVPSAVLPKLKTLASFPLVHAPLVDGPLALADVYTTGSWRTLLLGGLGGGGRTYFGLDVTAPVTSANGTIDPSKVLFELNDPDIGYSFSRPAIARQANGDWVAFFANGYGGDSKRAILFVKNLTSGVLTKIDTQVGSPSDPNGLSSPTVLASRIGKADAVYAGDYQGNLWKFVQNASGAWVLAHSGAPFFVAKRAGVRQPIFAAPALESHPAGGIMVLVGTGKYFETQDRTDTAVQTFYGLRDRGATISRQNLLQQTITEGNDTVDSARAVSDNRIDYRTAAGWYLDFSTVQNGTASGERIVASAIIVSDTVLFNTFVPSAQACVGIGSSFLMGVNLFNGGLSAPVFDDDGDGKIGPAERINGKPIAGRRSDTEGTLMSPVAVLVGLQSRGDSTIPSSGTCGGPDQPPCAGKCREPGYIVKGGLCKKLTCSTGSVVVNGSRCYLTTKRSTWTELR